MAQAEEQAPSDGVQAPRALLGDADLAAAEALEVDPDWRSYLKLAPGTRRLRRWRSADRPGLLVPVVETAMIDGCLGCAVWKSGSVLAEYIVREADQLFEGGEAIVELACGCGLPGIAAAAAARPSRVAFADLYPEMAELAREAAAAAVRASGAAEGAVQLDTFGFDWATEPESWGGSPHAFHVVLASDANDQHQRKPWALARAFDHFASRQGALVLDANPDTRGDLAEFREAMVREFGFSLQEPTWCRGLSDEPPVPGLTCGAEHVLVDVYRR